MDDDGSEGTGTGNVAGRFFDADGDDLSYSLVGETADDGSGVQPGDMVYRSSTDDQILTLNSETGAVTYYTNNGTSHDDGDTDDGAGNMFTVTVRATDDGTPMKNTGPGPGPDADGALPAGT